MRRLLIGIGLLLLLAGAATRTAARPPGAVSGERQAIVSFGTHSVRALFLGGCVPSGTAHVCLDSIGPGQVRLHGARLVLARGGTIHFRLGHAATERLVASLIYGDGRQRVLPGVRGHGRSWRVPVPDRPESPRRLAFSVRYGSDDASFVVRVAVEPRRGCPPTDRHLDQRGGPRGLLVPRGASGLFLCRYTGLNPDPARRGMLSRARSVAAAPAIRSLTDLFDRLRSFSARVHTCPADDGAETVAFFRYRHARTLPVTVQTSGCRYVSNGPLTRTAAFEPGPRLLRELTTLTK